MKQKLFELDVFPNVSSEVGEVESLTSRIVELSLANDGSFKDFIGYSVGEKAILSDNTRRDLNERKTQLDEAQTEMKQAFQSIQPLRNEQNTVKEQLNNFNKSLDAESSSLTKRIHDMQSTAKRLREADSKLKMNIDEMGTENVDECRKKLNENQKKMGEIRDECNRLTMVVAECDNRNQVIRRLEDRIRFLNTQEAITKLEAEVVEIRAKITRPTSEINSEVSLSNKKSN